MLTDILDYKSDFNEQKAKEVQLIKNDSLQGQLSKLFILVLTQF